MASIIRYNYGVRRFFQHSWPRSRIHQINRYIQTKQSPLKKPTKSVNTEKEELIYPPVLLIYNNGNTRTFVIGGMKLFVVIGAFMNVGYKLFPEVQNWENFDWFKSLEITIGSLIPPIIVTVLTHPYVATMALILPRSARASQKAFQAYVNQLNGDAKLLMTRVSPLGLPTRSQPIAVSDLIPLKPRYGQLANYSTFHGLNQYVGFGQKFYIGNLPKAEQISRAPGVWDKISKVIQADYERLRT